MSGKPRPSRSTEPRVVRTRRGFRLVHGRDVLSDVLARPGATGGFFDALAACAVVLAPGSNRLVLLGFAAGGVVAPLRALGYAGAIEAVDLSHDALPLFRAVAGDWAGSVRVARAEASAWLRRRRRRIEVLVEDLTVPGPGGATKPPVCFEILPRLVPQRLAPGGVVVTNVLPVPGTTWRDLLARLASPYPRALLVQFAEYENRILITGTELPDARTVSRRLRAALRGIRSRQATRLSVRELVR